MDIRKCLATENSRAMTDRVVKFVAADQKKFDQLMALFTGKDAVLSQRAAWAVGDIGVKNPAICRKHLRTMLLKLEDRFSHPAIPRHLLRILAVAEIPEKYCAEVLDYCYAMLRNENTPIAIRANAISVAAAICQKHPGLEDEFIFALTQLQKNQQPAAVVVRIRETMKLFAKAHRPAKTS